MFRAAGYAVGAFLILQSAGCFEATCTNSFAGLHNGDVVQTTIVRELPAQPPNDLRPPTCGALGDLNPGTVLQSSITLGGGDVDCYDSAIVTPQSLSTGMLTPDTTTGGMTVQLPNGCRGQFSISFGQQTANGSFLDDNSNAATPSWELGRTFTVEGDATLCFPDGTVPVTCADSFIATNLIVHE
ncbi:MAG TPA: hypothetical protein VK745_06580 [Polyangiaceae bacterium]|jgi:hypothetical protein|nr:hypothetical protein [Polyangiaceae bacterium]